MFILYISENCVYNESNQYEDALKATISVTFIQSKYHYMML